MVWQTRTIVLSRRPGGDRVPGRLELEMARDSDSGRRRRGSGPSGRPQLPSWRLDAPGRRRAALAGPGRPGGRRPTAQSPTVTTAPGPSDRAAPGRHRRRGVTVYTGEGHSGP